MKKLLFAAIFATGALGATAALAQSTVFGTLAECKAAAKVARAAGELVFDCHMVDGGWSYAPPRCQDGQCLPD